MIIRPLPENNFVIMKYISLALLCIVISVSSFSQKNETYDPSKATLEEQFNRLYKKSNNYQVYKVVKKTDLTGYWNNISDSLSTLQNNLSLNSKEIREQAARIRDLEESLASSESTIEELNGNMETISFLGGDWDKSSYKTTMWSIIFSLLGISIILFLRFMQSNKVTRNAKKELSQLEMEFDTYRKGSIQKEQEIKRKLQDYINKVAELTGV